MAVINQVRKEILKRQNTTGDHTMHRTQDFDELLSEELQNDEFAREYFLSIMKDEELNLSLLEALKHLIRKMGVKEYADLVGMKRQNVSRFLAQEEPPKLDTLNRMLAPFNLKAKLTIDHAA